MVWSKIKSSPNSGLFISLFLFGLPVALGILGLFLFTKYENDEAKVTAVYRWIEPLSNTEYNADGFTKITKELPDFHQARWERITLPDSIPLPASVDISPTAPMKRVWFKFNVHIPDNLGELPDIAVFGNRVIGGAYSVWINNELVYFDVKDWKIQWNYPLYVKVPFQLARPNSDIEVKIAIPYRTGQGYGMGTLYAGSSKFISLLRDIRTTLQTGFTQFSAIMMMIAGLMSLHLWLSRKQESQYLIIAMASVGFAICNMQYFYEISDNEALSAWFSSLVDSSVAWVLMLTYFYAMHIEKRSFPVFETILIGLTVGLTLLTLPIWDWKEYALMLQCYFEALVALVIAILFSYISYKGSSLEFKIIMLAEWAMLIFGIHSIAYAVSQVNPDHLYTFPYAASVLFFAFIFTSQRQHINATNQVEELNASLASKLAQRELELRHHHSKLLEIEKSQTLLLERQRLVRDMHDGIGSQLMTTLAIAKHGNIAPDKIAEILQDCIDDLKNVIDSLEPIGHDPATLLGILRQRLGSRIESAGIQLNWKIEDTPTLEWLEPPQALQLLRIMQEVITNILKHAQASKIEIFAGKATAPSGKDAILISIADDGKGFDLGAKKTGRGLNNIEHRANQLEAELQISSTLGNGTKVEIYLPAE